MLKNHHGGYELYCKFSDHASTSFFLFFFVFFCHANMVRGVATRN